MKNPGRRPERSARILALEIKCSKRKNLGLYFYSLPSKFLSLL
jgi:hypothetical protein